METKLSPPWVDYYNKINALFEKDPDVSIVFDEDAKEIRFYIEKKEKQNAIAHILPASVEFGNVVLKIMIVPSDDNGEDKSFIDWFKDAFDGNECVLDIKTGAIPLTSSISYVIFKKEVVQYFNDDLTTYSGFKSTLYEDIAKDVFTNADNVCFCTEVVPAN